MGFFHKGLVQGIVAETGVDMIIVRAGIAVVTLVVLIVQQERRGPDGGDAQVSQIVQMVDDALQVAAVTGHRVHAVHGIFDDRDGIGHHAGTVIVGQGVGAEAIVVGKVAVGKAVRHNQVHQVGRGETLPLGTPLLPFPDQIRILEGFPFPGEHQVIGARLGRGRHLHIHENKVGAIGLVNGLHFEALPGDGDVIG